MFLGQPGIQISKYSKFNSSSPNRVNERGCSDAKKVFQLLEKACLA